MSARIDGSWCDEPLYREFDECGYPCRMVRSSDMHPWRGYVGVTAEHPLHGVGYSDHVDALRQFVDRRSTRPDDPAFPVFEIMCARKGRYSPALALIVHGGLSYACGETPADVRVAWPAGRWWFGFDCGHHEDLQPWLCERSPGLLEDLVCAGYVWRSAEYVEGETRHLAEQLAEVAVAVKQNC